MRWPASKMRLGTRLGEREKCHEAWGSIINSLDALGVVVFLATILGHWAQ